jgi:transcriptional regulator with XRE-family HTH domain
MNNKDIKQKFGFAVRKFRIEQKMTQEELAERTGLHRTYISEVERGERNISLENIRKIACALNVYMSQLFKRVEEED